MKFNISGHCSNCMYLFTNFTDYIIITQIHRKKDTCNLKKNFIESGFKTIRSQVLINHHLPAKQTQIVFSYYKSLIGRYS